MDIAVCELVRMGKTLTCLHIRDIKVEERQAKTKDSINFERLLVIYLAWKLKVGEHPASGRQLILQSADEFKADVCEVIEVYT